VFGGGGHVVILGAGASIASTMRDPLASGKRLPSMDTFIEIVGLEDIVNSLPERLKAANFETLYTNLHQDKPDSVVIKEIGRRVYAYFQDMKLPDRPTIFDYMVLALRKKDCIATFNWDPFLYQAWKRNKHLGDMLYIAFLHGCVALGYSQADKRFGEVGWRSRKTGALMEPTKLLYPITQKNYSDDEFIKGQWDMLDSFLSAKAVKRLTIFGYGAPASDVEAIKMMNKAWGTGKRRKDEQVEIIDIRPEEQVLDQWKSFIYSGHTDYANDYFNSSLSWDPRRTFESYDQHYFPLDEDEAFSASNPVPHDFKTLEELWDWHRPLIEAEKRAKEKDDLKME
jgi:hypothetical protein